MPEGPELHLSSQFINSVCKGRIFSGTVRRNPIHKCADVVWNAAAYTISAVSRGKELKVFLQTLKKEADEKPNVENGTAPAKNGESTRLHLLFNFGMSGKFEFTPVSELPKHAHLSFFTQADDMALSFVDYRRFGKWQVGADWTPERGPCVLFEYPQFRSNVLNSLAGTAFNKPVCEVLLDQRYFNGIGNYLRAEICYRAGVRPFDQARTVFSGLPDVPQDVKVKTEDGVKETAKAKTNAGRPDILELCNTIALEVVGLGTSLYLPEDEHSDMSRFSRWVQCYYKPGMKNVADHNKRTMWYHGDPGPMVPREGVSKKRHAVYDKKLAKGGKKVKKEENENVDKKQTDDVSAEKKTKRAKRGKEEVPTSPAKPKRITRKSLQTLAEESTNTCKKAAKSKKAANKRSKAADGAVVKSRKKSLNGEESQNGEGGKGRAKSAEKGAKSAEKGAAEKGAKSAEKGAKSKGKIRATRASVKRAMAPE